MVGRATPARRPSANATRRARSDALHSRLLQHTGFLLKASAGATKPAFLQTPILPMWLSSDSSSFVNCRALPHGSASLSIGSNFATRVPVPVRTSQAWLRWFNSTLALHSFRSGNSSSRVSAS